MKKCTKGESCTFSHSLEGFDIAKIKDLVTTIIPAGSKQSELLKNF